MSTNWWEDYKPTGGYECGFFAGCDVAKDQALPQDMPAEPSVRFIIGFIEGYTSNERWGGPPTRVTADHWLLRAYPEKEQPIEDQEPTTEQGS